MFQMFHLLHSSVHFVDSRGEKVAGEEVVAGEDEDQRERGYDFWKEMVEGKKRGKGNGGGEEVVAGEDDLLLSLALSGV